MYDFSVFPLICRVCLKPAADREVKALLDHSDHSGLTYLDLLDELTFVAQNDCLDELPKHLCKDCAYRLDKMFQLKKQATVVLQFCILIIEARKSRDSNALRDYLKTHRDQLKECCKAGEIEPDDLVRQICGSPQQATACEEDTELSIEEIKRDVDSNSISLEDEPTWGSEPEDDKPVNDQSLNKLSKSTNKIIRRNGTRYKLCILPGCDEEYEMGNRPAYLEHEKNFHRYACNICGRVLASRTSFRNHVLLHDGETARVKCEFCERTFTTKGSMMVHVREVHNTSGVHFNCQYCEKGFIEQKDLFNHLQEEHRECKQCEEKFADLTGWIHHNRRHHADNLVRCEHCEHTSLSRALLERHKRMKHSESSAESKPQRFTIYAINSASFHQCPQCNLQFTTEQFLLSHIEQLHNRPPQADRQERHVTKRRSKEEREQFALRYSCDVCGRKYRFKNSLWSHKHKEHNMVDQKAICELCGQHFKHQSYLTAHIANKHATELPFQCAYCHRAFSQAYLLREHSKSHDTAKKHQCSQCEYRSKKLHTLKDHIMRVHTSDRPVQCALCDKRFVNNIDLRKHMAVHKEEMPFQCDECEQVFRRKMDLKRHKGRIHSKPSRWGAGEEVKYRCDDCEHCQEFKRRADLVKHRAKHHPEVLTVGGGSEHQPALLDDGSE